MKINWLLKRWGVQKFLSALTRATRWLLLFLAVGCLALIPLTSTEAQTSPPVLNRLPAPPPIPSGRATPNLKNPKIPEVPVQFTPAAPAMPPAIREYTFEAPQAAPISIPSSMTPNAPLSSSPASSDQLYRVEVAGDTQEVLAQVRQVEPLAFVRVGEGVIQAGLFPDAGEAQQRLLALQQQGLTAKVVAVGQDNEVASGAAR